MTDKKCRSSSLVVPNPQLPVLVPSSIFNDSRLKVYRAHCFAYEASQIWEIWIRETTDMARIDYDASSQTHSLYQNLLVPPAEFILPISDCLRCLRSGLDYLVSALARKASLPDDSILFPFGGTRGDVEKSFKDDANKQRRAQALYNVQLRYQGLKEIVMDRIQPWNGGEGEFGDFLWRLITMDNIDKHRLITPTVIFADVHTTAMPGLSIEGARISGFGKANPAFQTVGWSAAEGQQQPDSTVDAVFPVGTKLEGASVLSAFVKGANLVDDAVKIFASEFEGK
ncbi:hypothetical protein [Mesorhizobium sp. M0968]|uniref:hypothetical protein n=1 Tax=Mesorhizobium sp. M0968 TaxID=2957037 RepID=UPI003339D32F